MEQLISEYLDLFLNERLGRILSPLQKKDQYYKELIERQDKANNAFDKILDTLSDDDKEIMEDYIHVLSSVQGYENMLLYLHGYIHCTQFLHFFNILGD